MLSVELKEQLKLYLTRLASPIEIKLDLDSSEGAVEMKKLLADVAEASSSVSVVEASLGGRKPSFAIAKPGEAPRVSFSGLPLGHEFTSLVLALLHVSGYPPKVEPDQIELAKSLAGPFEFVTYFSQSCQNCPDVVQALNLLSALNPNVTHVSVDGALFQDEVTERQVMAVPTIFLNGERFGQGRMELAEILQKLDTAGAQRKSAKLNEKEPFDVLIVGGGPAGASAAIYSARKGIRTGIVAERFGGQVLDTLAIENFISVKETEGPAFARALEEHVFAYDVDVMKHERVKRIEPGPVLSVELESGAKLRSKSVVVATGARWRDMNVPGEQEYRTKGVTYCPHCDGPLFKGKDVAVIGGGNSGVEAAIDLAGVVKHVTLLEFASELRADAVLRKKLASLPNVTVHTDAQTTEVLGDGTKVTGLRYKDRKTDEFVDLKLQGIFVQIGLLPNTDFLKGTVELSPRGEVIVDDHGRTSVPGVFGAGDVTTTPFKQIIIATGDGAKAALGAFDYLIRQSP